MLSVIAICTGACLGALARWQLGLWLNPTTSEEGVFPWGTLAANLIGGYLGRHWRGHFSKYASN
jgi:fluoride exporter